MLLRRIIEILICFNNNVLAEMQGHVVEGDRVAIEKYPHSVFLEVWCYENFENELGWYCGASIINQQFTLTAANCLGRCARFGSISVTVGHADKRKGVSSSASAIKSHPEFDAETLWADIGLVRLKTPLKLGPKIKRVILKRNPPYRKSAYLAGWGLYKEGKEKPPNYLRHAKVRVWSLEECDSLLGPFPEGGMLCAGSKRGPYAGPGDTGSALVIEGHVQIGIFSFVKPSKSASIGGYVEVSHYYDWIVNSTAAMRCAK